MSNVKNYDPHQRQKIIISSDNDGNESLINNIIKDTRDILSRKGAFVEIVFLDYFFPTKSLVKFLYKLVLSSRVF